MRILKSLAVLGMVFGAALFGLMGSGAPLAAETPSVEFVGVDSTTQGDWPSVYGADGYSIAGHTTSIPSYLTLSFSGKSDWTWAESTTDARATRKTTGTDGIASCWYSNTNFSLALNLTGDAHRVALYSLDWDGYGGGRVQTIDVLDAATNEILDTQELTSFYGGKYLSWDISGNVILRVTNNNSNAVVAGIFFGGAHGAINLPPVAESQELTTALDTAASVTLTATDPNNDTLTYDVVSQPAHGALTGTAPNLTYTPETGFKGLDSFTFRANDGNVDSNVATAEIAVGVTKIVLEPTADSEVFDRYGDACFGSSTSLQCYACGNWASARALFRFDLSSLPAGKRILSARLKITTLYSWDSGAIPLRVYPLRENWVEGEATWNERATGTPWSTPGGSIEPAPFAEGNVSGAWGSSSQIEIGALAEAWRNGADNFGFELLNEVTPSTERDLASKEHSNPDCRPKLILILEDEPAQGQPGSATAPAPVTNPLVQFGDAKQTIGWTNPTDASHFTSLVLRRTGSADATIPTPTQEDLNGAFHAVGETFETTDANNNTTTWTAVARIMKPVNGFLDTGLTNDQPYTYAIYAVGNTALYAAPAQITGTPVPLLEQIVTLDGTVPTNESFPDVGSFWRVQEFCPWMTWKQGAYLWHRNAPGYAERTLVRFNLLTYCPTAGMPSATEPGSAYIPQGAKVRRAELVMVPGGSGTLNVYKVTEPWTSQTYAGAADSGAPSWLKRLPDTAWTNGDGAIPAGDPMTVKSDWIGWTQNALDITDALKSWVEHPETNFGILMMSPDNQGLDFYGPDNQPQFRPYLRVIYEDRADTNVDAPTITSCKKTVAQKMFLEGTCSFETDQLAFKLNGQAVTPDEFVRKNETGWYAYLTLPETDKDSKLATSQDILNYDLEITVNDMASNTNTLTDTISWVPVDLADLAAVKAQVPYAVSEETVLIDPNDPLGPTETIRKLLIQKGDKVRLTATGSSVVLLDISPEIGVTATRVNGDECLLYTYNNAVSQTEGARTEVETATATLLNLDENNDPVTLATLAATVIPVVADMTYPLTAQIGFTRESEHDYIFPKEAAQYAQFSALNASQLMIGGQHNVDTEWEDQAQWLGVYSQPEDFEMGQQVCYSMKCLTKIRSKIISRMDENGPVLGSKLTYPMTVIFDNDIVTFNDQPTVSGLNIYPADVLQVVPFLKFHVWIFGNGTRWVVNGEETTDFWINAGDFEEGRWEAKFLAGEASSFCRSIEGFNLTTRVISFGENGNIEWIRFRNTPNAWPEDKNRTPEIARGDLETMTSPNWKARDFSVLLMQGRLWKENATLTVGPTPKWKEVQGAFDVNINGILNVTGLDADPAPNWNFLIQVDKLALHKGAYDFLVYTFIEEGATLVMKQAKFRDAIVVEDPAGIPTEEHPLEYGDNLRILFRNHKNVFAKAVNDKPEFAIGDLEYKVEGEWPGKKYNVYMIKQNAKEVVATEGDKIGESSFMAVRKYDYTEVAGTMTVFITSSDLADGVAGSLRLSPLKLDKGYYTLVVEDQENVAKKVAFADAVTVIDVQLKKIWFNHDQNSSANDALNIRKDKDTAIAFEPEFDKDAGKSNEAAYDMFTSAKIKVTLTLAPPDYSNKITVRAINKNEESGGMKDVEKTEATFANGSAENVEMGTMPADFIDAKKTQWAWEFQLPGRMKFTEFAQTEHQIFTVLSEPKAPWNQVPNNRHNPWVNALNFTITKAMQGKTDQTAAIVSLTKFLHGKYGLQYDTVWANPHYGAFLDGGPFELTGYINKSAGPSINCYDQAQALCVLSNLVGVDSYMLFLRPFGYVSASNLVGIGQCNNPAYNYPSNLNPYLLRIPVVPSDRILPQRMPFTNHLFVGLSGNIYDATLGPCLGMTLQEYLGRYIDTSGSTEAIKQAKRSQAGSANQVQSRTVSDVR